jgi:hypothetical protein
MGQREGREEATRSEGSNQKGKHIFHEDAYGTRASRAGWVKRWPVEKRWPSLADWASWAGPRRRFKWGLIFEFQGFWNLGKTLGNFTKRFRRNLDMRSFPKFF